MGSTFFEQLASNQSISTVILILAVMVAKLLSKKFLERPNDDREANENRRRLQVNIRNLLVVVLIIGLVFIWAPALRTFALSLTAFAVATIIATKELILCLSGYIVHVSSHNLRIGDWVEINGVRGEVVDQSFMTTTLEEIGRPGDEYAYTGKTVTLPNSIFLNSTIFNERFNSRFSIHCFHLVVERNLDFAPIEKAALTALADKLGDMEEIAIRYGNLIEKRAGIRVPSPKGESRLVSTNDGRTKMIFTAFLPSETAIAIEQAAIRAALEEVTKQTLTRPKPSKNSAEG